MSVASATGYASVPAVIGELRDRSASLFAAAAINLVLFALMAMIALFDTRSVLGLNPWFKPMKFALSIAIYTATVGWFLRYLPIADVSKRWLARGISIAMLIEIALITLQAARGVGSHFNTATPFDAGVQGIMITMVIMNTVLVVYLLVRFWQTKPSLAPAYLWGIRLGFFVFFLANLVGVVMGAHGGHTVGMPDGGPGLPFLNWSTVAGDLRISHLVGLHGLQAIPLVGYVFAVLAERSRITHPVAGVWTYAISHAGVGLMLFLMALAGQPLVRL